MTDQDQRCEQRWSMGAQAEAEAALEQVGGQALVGLRVQLFSVRSGVWEEGVAEESSTRHLMPFDAFWNQLDVDHDGRVTLTELAAHYGVAHETHYAQPQPPH